MVIPRPFCKSSEYLSDTRIGFRQVPTSGPICDAGEPGVIFLCTARCHASNSIYPSSVMPAMLANDLHFPQGPLRLAWLRLLTAPTTDWWLLPTIDALCFHCFAFLNPTDCWSTSTSHHLHSIMLAGFRSLRATTSRAGLLRSSMYARPFSAVAPGGEDRPLAGIKVVDLTRVLAGPTATMMLVSLSTWV